MSYGDLHPGYVTVADAIRRSVEGVSLPAGPYETAAVLLQMKFWNITWRCQCGREHCASVGEGTVLACFQGCARRWPVVVRGGDLSVSLVAVADGGAM